VALDWALLVFYVVFLTIGLRIRRTNDYWRARPVRFRLLMLFGMVYLVGVIVAIVRR
jgi:succinate dehydrogenase hydrophobic anchor subunit